MKPIPNPGTDEAIDAGCTCPVMDNEYGAGYMWKAGTFIYTMNCPVHEEMLKESHAQYEKERMYKEKENRDYQI